jgi:hypothetical protein
MSFFKSISKHFGFPGRDPSGTWPRIVPNNVLPPERQPIVPPKQRRPLPPGVREVADATNHRGHIPWTQRQPQPTDILKHDDMKQMKDFINDGAIDGGPKRKTGGGDVR